MARSSGPDTPIVAALLAGGASRRMGDRPLAQWAAATLAAVAEQQVQVGGEPIAGIDWPVLEDLRAGAGPAAGLETALATFPGAAIVVCALDAPFVPAALLRHALARLESGLVAALPRIDGLFHPLIGAWSPAALPSLSAWLDAGGTRLQEYLANAPVATLSAAELRRFGDPGELLLNVNTPAELARAEQLLAARARC